jgi:hypothetical protein
MDTVQIQRASVWSAVFEVGDSRQTQVRVVVSVLEDSWLKRSAPVQHDYAVTIPRVVWDWGESLAMFRYRGWLLLVLRRCYVL